MRYRGKIIGSTASIVLVLAIGYYLGMTAMNARDFDWKELSIDQSSKGYGYTSEALFNSDIRLPEIKKLSGKFKFIELPNAGSDELNLGYVISVDIEKLDLQKIPQKYKVERTEQYKAGEFMWGPIEDVVYSVSFTFKLKDRDGFEIVTLKTPSYSI